MKRRDLFKYAAAVAANSLLSPSRAQQVPARSRSMAGPKTDVKARVIVIGAGISGLGAAKRLVSEYGLTRPNDVIVLESRNRLGGRIHTDTSLASPVDLGAGWIHGSVGNPITALANQFGAATVTVSGSQDLFDIDGSLVPGGIQSVTWQQYLNARSAVRAYIAGLTVDQPLELSYLQTGAGADLSGKPLRVFKEWLGEIEAGWTAYNSQLSSLHHNMGSAFGGADRLFPGGYSQVVEGVANGLDVRLGHVVKMIDYGRELVWIQTDRGTFAAEKCIVTLPLGVLKAGLVPFQPALPSSLQEAIGRMGFGAAYKIAMEFPEVFWRQGRTYLSYISPQPGESTDWRNVREYSPGPILNTWAYQDYARNLEAMSVGDATARVMQDLRKIYGADTPNPTKVVASDWNSSPYTQGSYSYPAVGSTPADYGRFLAPLSGKLFFAGEHTNALYPSTVHGAYLSGRAAAARVMAGWVGRLFGGRPWARLPRGQ